MGLPVPGVLDAAHAAGIERVITVGVDLESSRWSAQVRGGVREPCTPPSPSTPTARARSPRVDDVLAEIETLAGLPQVRAVGETGLDYYRDPPTLRCSVSGSVRTSVSRSGPARR